MVTRHKARPQNTTTLIVRTADSSTLYARAGELMRHACMLRSGKWRQQFDPDCLSWLCLECLAAKTLLSLKMAEVREELWTKALGCRNGNQAHYLPPHTASRIRE